MSLRYRIACAGFDGQGKATEANRKIPIFAAHGTEDDVVSIDLGLSAREYLQQNGYACQWREYPMPHSVCIEDIQDIGTWLNGLSAK